MKYISTKTDNELVEKLNMYHRDGGSFSGLVDEQDNVLYDNPEDSYNKSVGMKTDLEEGLIKEGPV